MFQFQLYNRKNYRFQIVICVAILAVIGMLILNSAMANDADRDSTMYKQIAGLLVGTGLMVLFTFVDYHFVLKFSPILLLLNFGLLALVLTPFGVTSHGATRWLNLGVQIQPSEFAKIILIFFLAWFMGRHADKVSHPLVVFTSLAAFAVTAFLILAEPDLSTTLVVTFIFLTVMYASKVSYKWFLAALLILIPLALLAVVIVSRYSDYLINELHIYQVQRVLSWLHPEQYSSTGTNLQQDNSVLAIASGQLFGKGLNNTSFESVKNGNFLSEANSDFIFAVIGEELGFVGSIVIIAVYCILIGECIRVASRSRDLEGKVLCTGMASLIAFQTFVNIGVAIKLLPNTGLPLPFFSAGLSSLLSLFLGIGVVLNVSLQQKEPVSDW